jgi:hypothetical protein
MHHHPWGQCKVVRPLVARIEELQKELQAGHPTAQPLQQHGSLGRCQELLQSIMLHVRRNGTAILQPQQLPEDLLVAFEAAGVQQQPSKKAKTAA